MFIMSRSTLHTCICPFVSPVTCPAVADDIGKCERSLEWPTHAAIYKAYLQVKESLFIDHLNHPHHILVSPLPSFNLTFLTSTPQAWTQSTCSPLISTDLLSWTKLKSTRFLKCQKVQLSTWMARHSSGKSSHLQPPSVASASSAQFTWSPSISTPSSLDPVACSACAWNAPRHAETSFTRHPFLLHPFAFNVTPVLSPLKSKLLILYFEKSCPFNSSLLPVKLLCFCFLWDSSMPVSFCVSSRM